MPLKNITLLIIVGCVAFFLFSCNLEDQIVNNQPADTGQTTGDDANRPSTPDGSSPDGGSPNTGSPDTDLSPSDTGCVPGTCASLEAQCGVIADGCAGTIDCGECDNGICGRDNQCTCSPETVAAFCDRLGAECGPLTALDNCGSERTVMCGACEGVNVCEQNSCGCTPQTCAANICGQVADGCGNIINCGSCTQDGEVCGGGGANRCGEGECAPETCESLDARCGLIGDGCGEVLECGACQGTGETCTGQNACLCTPETRDQFCERLGARCGTATGNDNCGAERTENCGTCTAPDTCDANNRCACQGESHTALCDAHPNILCGSAEVQNQCGQTVEINCGDCSGQFDACNDNQCQCQGESNAALCASRDYNCGPANITDRCGVNRSVACGTCGSGDTCTNNQCSCVGEAAEELCAANLRDCGPLQVTDSCGATREIDCGTCSPGTCLDGQCCQPKTCAEAGATCGTINDGCGRALSCGSCSYIGWVSSSGPYACCSGSNLCTCQNMEELTNSCTDNQCVQSVLDTDVFVTNCGSCSDGDNCTTNTCIADQCITSPNCSGTTTSCGCTSCTNCASRDGWYPVGSSYPCCRHFGSSFGSCQCQNEEFRAYSCAGTRCTYSVVNSRVQESDLCLICNNGCNLETGSCCTEQELCLM